MYTDWLHLGPSDTDTFRIWQVHCPQVHMGSYRFIAFHQVHSVCIYSLISLLYLFFWGGWVILFLVQLNQTLNQNVQISQKDCTSLQVQYEWSLNPWPVSDYRTCHAIMMFYTTQSSLTLPFISLISPCYTFVTAGVGQRISLTTMLTTIQWNGRCRGRNKTF